MFSIHRILIFWTIFNGNRIVWWLTDRRLHFKCLSKNSDHRKTCNHHVVFDTHTQERTMEDQPFSYFLNWWFLTQQRHKHQACQMMGSVSTTRAQPKQAQTPLGCFWSMCSAKSSNARTMPSSKFVSSFTSYLHVTISHWIFSREHGECVNANAKMIVRWFDPDCLFCKLKCYEDAFMLCWARS